MILSDLYSMFFESELTWSACLVRIFVSFLFGCIFGLERKKRQQFIGIRTVMLICVSSTLLMMLSIYAGTKLPNGTGDPTRIAAQVVSGIGF
ncbi:MAG: MgtC/SapB family protein, partial [Spirochaetales bacterium]